MLDGVNTEVADAAAVDDVVNNVVVGLDPRILPP